MDAYSAVLREFFRLVGELWLAKIEARLQKFADVLDEWLRELFARPMPDWRERLDQFLTAQEAEGYLVAPESREDLVAFLEAWEKTVDWRAVGPIVAQADAPTTEDSRPSEREAELDHIQPGAALRYLIAGSEEAEAIVYEPSGSSPQPRSGRRDQSAFAEAAEEIVSEATGVPRNQGPRRQEIPGSGPGGFRVPDFPVRGPAGSVRQRGAVIEVKASRGKKFGDLSGLSRRQIRDAVQFVQSLRNKASLVKAPTIKSLLENARVEVFSDLPQPRTGRFARLIRDGVLEWKPIPRATPVTGTAARGARAAIPSASRSMGKPGVGATANIALGLIASLAEAGVADSVHNDAASVLEDLLRQIEKNGDAEDKDWQEIDEKLREISNMSQSKLGHVWEL